MKQFFSLTCLLFLLCLSSLPAQKRGFTAQSQSAQETLEQEFLKLPQPEQFAAHLRKLTERPHIAGSPENKQVADYMTEVMAKAGWKVAQTPYDVYLPTGPGEIRVELVTPIRLPLNNKEYILPEDPYSSDPLLLEGWNSFSGSGDVTGEVVYANYGTKEDFEQLAKMGISVKGKIVLARYGGNFRGYKAKYAEAAGAAGLIIFTDPGDSGYMKGLVFPEGSFYSESTIQRGSLLTLDFTGDPLTPFEPALPRDSGKPVKRLDPSEVAFHTIPVTPLPYGAVKEIFSRMKGASVPAGWQGGLPYTYRLTGGPELTVHLKVKQEKDLVRIQNVIATLEGSEFPDEWIIAGSHYDAWGFGASDPNSGTAMLLCLAEALGELKQKGMGPKRTIKIAHWDAEEHGIIGSTEWVEQWRDELDKKAVAYFNADGAVSGLNFGGSAAPSLKNLMIEAARTVPYLNTKQTVYEHWMTRAADKAAGPPIGNLGGGSDHLPFYAHVGIPSLSAGLGGPTLYHSNYDDFYWYSHFADTSFTAGPTVTKMMGIMALRMANAAVLPFEVSRYGTDLHKHLSDAAKRIQAYQPSFDITPLLKASQNILEKGKRLDSLISVHLKTKPNAKTLAALNGELLILERNFIDPTGQAYGSWYRSLYASSDPFSGYASWMLPGFLYEASLKSSDNLPALEQRHMDALKRLESAIDRMLKRL